jgi:uncharacterized membrane protein HdeD (DUF308 family)
MTQLADAVNAGGKNMTAYGVIAIILGMLAMLAPGLTGLSITVFLGILVLGGGVVRMIWAFQAGSFGRGVLMFAIGVLTLLCGIVLVANPLLAAGMLTVMVAVYFILDGIVEIAGGVQLRPKPGSGWMIFGGIVSIFLGFMIWGQYPLAGPYALGILLGIKLFFVGLIMVTGGSKLRALAKS